MKILYDPCIFMTQRLGGVSRCFADLMLGISALGEHPFVPIPYKARKRNIYLTYIRHLMPHYGWKWPLRSALSKFMPKRKRKTYMEKLWSREEKEMVAAADIVHAGQFDKANPLLYSHGRLVTTVHDMIPESEEGGLLREIWPMMDEYSRTKKIFVEHSKRIIAISEYTRQELIRLWNIDPSKIDVVYHSNPFERFCIPPPTPGRSPYILYVGNRLSPYKNFIPFLRGVAPLLRERKGLRLICTSADHFDEKEEREIQRLGIAGKVESRSVTDEELVRLYVDASLFCFPSRAEGFGLPLLEAFACSCPVCCSNASCFPEIAGEAACYFDPLSPESMTLAMGKVLDDRGYRESLVAKGRERLALFHSRRTAQAALAVYRKLL